MKPRNIRDSYKLYKAENPDGVDIKTYINMCNEFNKFLIEKVLEGEEVTLPARMGTIYIFGRKQEISFDENGNVKGLAPDWVKTKKLWQNNPEAKQRKQIMYHTNESTGGIRYKFLWAKNGVYLTNKSLYSLRLSRANKRAILEKVRGGKEYIIKEPHYKEERLWN